MAGLRETMREAVRKLAYRTTVDNLRKRGVEQVSIVGLDRISRLVEESVHRGLRSRLGGLEREAAADAAKAEFLRLIRSNEDLQKSRSELEQLKERAEEEVDRLRRELEQDRQALAKRLEPADLGEMARTEGENARLAERLTDLFRVLASEPELRLGHVQEKVMELLFDAVGTERKAADAMRRELEDREVELLQRRIRKLTETLEQTETRLKEVSSLKTIEQGISSVYREVQGLKTSEPEFEARKGLMSAIFDSNLRLQKKKA